MSANTTGNEDRPVNIEMTMSESVSSQPSDGAKSLSTLKKQDYLLGIGLLLVVVFLWTSSNFITQDLLETGYEKPFIITYLNTSAFVVYLLPFLYRQFRESRRYGKARTTDGYQSLPVDASQGDSEAGIQQPAPTLNNEDGLSPLTIRDTIKLASVFCIFWFIANWSVNVALEYTSVASATILSSMSGFFTLAIGRIFRVETFTMAKIAAIVMSFIGVVFVSISDTSETRTENLIPRAMINASPSLTSPSRPLLGDSLALLSAVFYALYVILLKVRIKSESRIDMQLFFGFVGLFNIIGCWPIAVILHYTGLEPFSLPHGRKAIMAILMNMFITWSSDYIYVLAMLKTTPLVVTVGLSLTIPLAVVGDFFLAKPTKGQVIVGAILVVIGFITIGVGGPGHEGSEEEHVAAGSSSHPRRSQSVAPEEVELLPDGPTRN
ncbi:hypothetical protein BDN71DRAFT_1441341 [Pleurotus eryngii]|uniref:EamA domain-containing protein n=1 Tax=Pleurotus eryngii TaxID=5323 RepID=A0A9P6DIR7_PLEER|nr:hypothetical protein BDN71DRAFT_1441341 [Pleurotus eryngii]